MSYGSDDPDLATTCRITKEVTNVPAEKLFAAGKVQEATNVGLPGIDGVVRTLQEFALRIWVQFRLEYELALCFNVCDPEAQVTLRKCVIAL